MNQDVVIVGAGPAGLCLARALSGQGLSITVLEKQSRQAIAEPAFDGREIAMTHASIQELERLGIWQRLPAEEIAPLCDAQVFNGPSLYSLNIRSDQVGKPRLGYFAANHTIRRAVYEVVSERDDISLNFDSTIQDIQSDAQGITTELADGTRLRSRLLIAADSRFSETRRRLGIGAKMKDFGKTMLVCRMEHEQPHNHVAWEWFGYGQTLALLPLNGNCSSTVLTLPQRKIDELMALDEDAFAREMERRYAYRLGSMKLVSSRHAYPLVGVFADRLAGQRCALVGDTAVGMHPVTAHGFNFGLASQRRLASAILEGHRWGRDIGSSSVLQSYARNQKLASWPLYQATNLLVELYTNDHKPMRLLRNAGLRAAQSLPPVRWAIARYVTQPAGRL